jgi:hypothetical protein
MSCDSVEKLMPLYFTANYPRLKKSSWRITFTAVSTARENLRRTAG